MNNDICYPSILVTGQIMEAVLSGKYDTDKLAVLITQTGGGCRATNYISLIRKALKSVGLGTSRSSPSPSRTWARRTLAQDHAEDALPGHLRCSTAICS